MMTFQTIERPVERFAVFVRVKLPRQRERTLRLMRLAPPGTTRAFAFAVLRRHQEAVMRRWLLRAVKRLPERVVVVDDPTFGYSDAVADDFIQNMGRYRASVRCLVDPPEWVGETLRVAPGTHVVKFAVPPENVSAF